MPTGRTLNRSPHTLKCITGGLRDPEPGIPARFSLGECHSGRAFEATGGFWRLSDTTSSPFWDCCYRNTDTLSCGGRAEGGVGGWGVGVEAPSGIQPATLALLHLPVTSFAFMEYHTCVYATVPSRTRRPTGEMLVRGSEDGHEAAGPAGAAGGPGLSPVNKHNPEGLSRAERQGDARPAELYRCLFVEAYEERTLPQDLAPHGEHLNRCHNSNTVQGSSLASLFLPVRGCEVFGALLCVCHVNTLFRCFGVTDRKSPSCVVFVIEQRGTFSFSLSSVLYSFWKKREKKKTARTA